MQDWIVSFLLTENKELLLMNVTLAGLMSLVAFLRVSTEPNFIFLYINDLPDLIHNRVLLFADDTKLFSRIRRDNNAHVIISSYAAYDIDT